MRKVLKVAKLPRIADFLRRPMEHVEQQRLQQLRRVAPAGEVEGLELAEGERVLGVVEEESVLACACPAIKPVLQFADDAGEIRERPLAGFQHVDPLDGIPQPDLFFEVEPVSLARRPRSARATG